MSQSGVHCYHIYMRKLDEYGEHHDLCQNCVNSFTIDEENCSLHDSGPTSRPCEICNSEES